MARFDDRDVARDLDAIRGVLDNVNREIHEVTHRVDDMTRGRMITPEVEARMAAVRRRAQRLAARLKALDEKTGT